jgi:quinoprotein glucose dehydrogenase
MTRTSINWIRGSALAATVLFCVASVPRQTAAGAGRNVNWTQYFADAAGSRYEPLDQINASNFNDLEVAWRFKTDNFGNRPEYKLEGTPLEVDGILYATAGNRRDVVALNATTGELLWVHGEQEGERGAAAPRQLSGRGLSYWPGVNGRDARIVYVTPGYFLVALDARTGQPAASFGVSGKVDLKATDDQKIEPDLTTGEIGWQSAPTVVGNEVLVGSAFREGFTPTSFRNNRGSARAYDVRSGKKLWQWNTIPRKDEKGYETWLNDSADYTGNTGIWTEITADPEAGLAYLPVEAPTSDFFGGKRPGDNLFSDCLVAVDLKTGKMKWYYQVTHHDIWDLDMSSAPLLMDITVDNKPIKAVAVPTKMGMLFVFDRITGKPVWPIPETAVPQDKVPGEWYSPTQPIPSKPAAYGRNGVTADDLISFTPALHEKALELAKDYRLGPVYTPPVLSQEPPAGPRATLSVGPATGGTNWPGGSFNPENHTVYVMSCDGCLGAYGLVTPPKNFTDLPYVEGQVGQHIVMVNAAGAGQGADAVTTAPPPAARGARGGGVPALTVDGLPLLKPPYSTLSAINLDTGAIVWQVAHGDTPDYIRNSPDLKGLDIPRTGQRSYNIGTLVTQSLVIAGDAMVTTTPDHPRGAMLRAYDQKTGKEVGGVLMPAPQSGSPMTYMVNGKQYIIVAVSGGNYSGEYICYTLPASQ